MTVFAAILNHISIKPVRTTVTVAAAAALAIPLLLPASSFGALDTLSEISPPAQPAETVGQNFPGSAFFFAEGAFAPDQGNETLNSADVFVLHKTATAPMFPFVGATAIDRYRAANCLTSAIYYEAGNEPDDGQRAVAQVVLNRVRHPAWPNSVCGVVYQGSERADMKCQFTFSCDGAMARIPVADKWARARRVALRALAGEAFAPVGTATHYHTLAVHPGWAGVEPVAVVGAHIFYVMTGERGKPQSFSVSYSRRELIAGPAPRLVAPVLPVPEAMPVDLPAVAISPAYPLQSRAGAQEQHAIADHGAYLADANIRPEYRNSGRPLF